MTDNSATIPPIEVKELVVQDCEFWCVWTKKGWAPKKFHNSEDAAVTEADRLARQYPNRKFIVMRAFRKCIVVVPEREAA